MDDSFEDVSRAVFNKYYELAVMDIFHSYGDVLNELVSLMTPDVLYTGSVYGREYHNTELLIKIYPIACRQVLSSGIPCSRRRSVSSNRPSRHIRSTRSSILR